MTCLDKVRSALSAVSANVGHYFAAKKAAPYIVWAEDSANDPCAGDVHEDIVTVGTVDLFTRTEGDPLVSAIETALESAGLLWYLNSVQHEDETGLIHYEWVWEGDNG